MRGRLFVAPYPLLLLDSRRNSLQSGRCPGLSDEAHPLHHHRRSRWQHRRGRPRRGRQARSCSRPAVRIRQPAGCFGHHCRRKYRARAAPDGYTVYLGHHWRLAINVSLFKKLPVRSDQRFRAVLACRHAAVHARRASVRARKIGQRPDRAGEENAGPESLFSHTGVGSATHLAGALLEGDAGVTFLSVP